jgi:isopenicillin-N epimerase
MDHRVFWGLDPAITFMNHGSFGACPRPVLQAQTELRERMEQEPVRFFVRELPGMLDSAREALAGFLCAEPADLVFVPNVTTAVNSVLRSLDLGPGDELLTTNHAYNACKNALDFVAGRSSARVVVAKVPFPLESDQQVVQSILEAVTHRTRLALFDHVTSQTGLVFPVARLVEELEARQVDTLIDGAHAPGMLPLDCPGIGAAYYAGNCHKWLCAPKGAGFLWVRPDRQHSVRPLAISHGANFQSDERSRFHLEFDYTGTDDPTACLAVPVALEFLSNLLPGGISKLMEHNRLLALRARRILSESLGLEPPCPESMIGSLATLPLPDGPAEQGIRSPLYLDPLQDILLERHGIEVPIIPWPRPPHRLLRVSAQIYNQEADYRRLADTLSALL